MWYNLIIKILLRSPLHFIVSNAVMLLKYQGRKSGRYYTVPVSYSRDAKDLLVISQRKRSWWRSLVGGAPVEVRLQGHWSDARAEAFTDPEIVAKELALYLEKFSYLAKHMDIEMGEDGKPEPESLLRAAEKRIMVRIKFPGFE
jgi:hypothetical protein